MPNKIRQKPRLDPRVKAWSPIYVVLCRDGKPHAHGFPAMTTLAKNEPVQLTYSEALTWVRDFDAMERQCGPHRVQAYRPMT